MKADCFTYKYEVAPKDIDELNHLNNIRSIELVLDAAKQHWEHLASTKLKSEFAWFLVEHHIKYKSQGFLGDQLSIVTWVKTTSGVKSIRVVEIYRNDTLLTTSTTTWCLVNQATKTLSKIPPEILSLFN
ncbi:acyl-CoA thioesterase [Psychroflexus sp. ALD_RP9]|uniref:acyl-CoA thioesterase n=1 Tax=Psychroflexus sp. ALD_RP9 TaxID=2777186 RepID=UPI001A8F79DF|nr:acyl-CoA thioesterase [Psychroflexus sp. ALD_RP9]QSS96028.1 acyl-CoA thioesterase [Psychroflexus sp. ALD_RP9]